jgi:hypothetical protein
LKKAARRVGKTESARSVLDHDLPTRGSTEKQDALIILQKRPDRLGNTAIVRRGPEQRVGVQQ